MPIATDFSLPGSPDALGTVIPNDPNAELFIAFITSNDPITNQSWCPDVRAALPALKATFSADGAPSAVFVEVGQLSEWRDPDNVYRTRWNVRNVPSVVRYQRVDGGVKETGRLVESEILDAKRLGDFVGKQ